MNKEIKENLDLLKVQKEKLPEREKLEIENIINLIEATLSLVCATSSSKRK